MEFSLKGSERSGDTAHSVSECEGENGLQPGVAGQVLDDISKAGIAFGGVGISEVIKHGECAKKIA